MRTGSGARASRAGWLIPDACTSSAAVTAREGIMAKPLFKPTRVWQGRKGFVTSLVRVLKDRLGKDARPEGTDTTRTLVAESRHMRIGFTDRELDVMSVLWDLGDATVTEVRERLADKLAYTTVLTVLRTLE